MFFNCREINKFIDNDDDWDAINGGLAWEKNRQNRERQWDVSKFINNGESFFASPKGLFFFKSALPMHFGCCDPASLPKLHVRVVIAKERCYLKVFRILAPICSILLYPLQIKWRKRNLKPYRLLPWMNIWITSKKLTQHIEKGLATRPGWYKGRPLIKF